MPFRLEAPSGQPFGAIVVNEFFDVTPGYENENGTAVVTILRTIIVCFGFCGSSILLLSWCAALKVGMTSLPSRKISPVSP